MTKYVSVFMPLTFKHFLSISTLLLLSGCATLQLNNLFASYSKGQQTVRNQIAQGNISGAIQAQAKPIVGNTNYQLALLEQGRLSFLAQDYEQSQWWFEQAYQTFERERGKANLRVGRGVEKFNTLVTNDNAMTYLAPAYEQSLMHGYQALNYAFQHDIEGALVEVRRANLIQEKALEQYEDELAEAKTLSKVSWNEIDKATAGLNSRIGEVKNGFQNAYTFYLSGVLYEAAGQLNDAYIDYKKALEIYPDNTYLQKDVLRLGSALGMDNDVNLFSQRFAHDKVELNANNGELVIIYEQGLIDAKQENKLNLPVWTSGGDMRFYSFAVPSYNHHSFVEKPVVIEINGEILSSEVIVKLQALVAKQLKDNMPSIVTRQALRIISKEQVRRKLSREGGDVGNILAGLYNLASEQADTRSWLSIPGDVQILRAQLPAGKHDIALAGLKNNAQIDANIKAGKITLVFVTEVNSFQTLKVVNL